MQNRRPGGGRPPKADSLKIINGTFKGTNKKRSGLDVGGGYPEMPPCLNPVAVQEWNRLKLLLEPQDLFNSLDTALLGAYCAVYSRWVEACEMLDKEGAVIETPQGPKQSAWFKLWAKCNEQLRFYLTELGMTPLSRGKFPAAETPPAKNGFAKFKKDPFGVL